MPLKSPGVVAVLVFASSLVAIAQIRPDNRGDKDASIFGVDWSKGDAPLVGESREAAAKRLLGYTPDPMKYQVPRTPWDHKPYFGGVWWPSDVELAKAPVPLETLYKKGPDIQARRDSIALANWKNGFSRPMFNCIPTRIVEGNTGGPISTQIVHGPGVMSVFPEAGNYRLIRIGDTPRNAARKPSYMGDAVGHWEGDALVVETTNFKDGMWLGGPQGQRPPQTASDALRVVERWTLPDARFLEYRVTIYDDKMLTGPWTGPTLRIGRTRNDAVIESQPCFEDPVLVKMEEEYQAKQREKGQK
jgi:hypothetical protein